MRTSKKSELLHSNAAKRCTKSQRRSLLSPVLTKLKSMRCFPRRLHADESGSISIVTLFAVMLLAVLLGMIINIGRHVDRKVKMQNAVDNAAYSGGVVLARSMNTFAFTNHLLCDVFGMTAYMREAKERNAESLVEPVLVAWEKVAPKFTQSAFPKFADLGPAIPEKVRLERELVLAFSEKNAAVSEQILPTLEEILSEEMIPIFQRSLYDTAPRLAQEATNEIARRHGNRAPGLSNRTAMQAALWRTDVTLVGSGSEMMRSSLPVVDPVNDISTRQPQYFDFAKKTRRDHAHTYLRQLNHEALRDFDEYARMCQFGSLWRGFTCGQLNKLLGEYPDTNLPFVLRQDDLESYDRNQYLETQYMFVGVAYWEKMPERLPGLFENPMDVNQATFAQVSLFLPRPKLRRRYDLPPEDPRWIYREGIPTHWDLMNQNWNVQLVPATAESVPYILQTPPQGSTIAPQNLGGISNHQFQQLNTH